MVLSVVIPSEASNEPKRVDGVSTWNDNKRALSKESERHSEASLSEQKNLPGKGILHAAETAFRMT
jgi:hypothetical protein